VFVEAVFNVQLALLALILAAIPAVRLIHLAIDGQLEAGPVLIGLFLYLALIVSVAGGPGPIKVAALALILLSTLLMPLLSGMQAERERRQIDDERFEAYVSALERNPMDPVARVALAEELHKRGDVQQAIAHLEWVLQEFPKLATQHRATLDSWKRELEEAEAPEFIYCHMCHAEVPAGTSVCPQCGAPFATSAGILERIRAEGGVKAILRAWIVAVVAVMLGLFVLLEVPAIVAAPILMAILIVGAWLFLRWVAGDIGRPAD